MLVITRGKGEQNLVNCLRHLSDVNLLTVNDSFVML